MWPFSRIRKRYRDDDELVQVASLVAAVKKTMPDWTRIEMTESRPWYPIATAPRERWRVIKPNGEPCDFLDEDRERAEDHMIAEALTGSRPDRESCIRAAEDAGYWINRIGSVH